LPRAIREKADKQLRFLGQDLRYPSLRAKKFKGEEDTLEARVNRFYRMTFLLDDNEIFLLTVGPHDKALKR